MNPLHRPFNAKNSISTLSSPHMSVLSTLSLKVMPATLQIKTHFWHLVSMISLSPNPQTIGEVRKVHQWVHFRKKINLQVQHSLPSQWSSSHVDLMFLFFLSCEEDCKKTHSGQQLLIDQTFKSCYKTRAHSSEVYQKSDERRKEKEDGRKSPTGVVLTRILSKEALLVTSQRRRRAEEREENRHI